MYFVVIGMDGSDADAPARRQTVRAQHLEGIAAMKAAGKVISAAAFVDDEDRMIGSMLLVSVDSRDEIDAWFANEPYVQGGVWQEITVRRAKVPPMFLAD